MSGQPFDLPKDLKADVQIFNLPTTVTNLQWHPWERPYGKTMCHIICIGGGGGGGGGFTAAAAAARGGGGGGGSSGVTRVTIPLFLLGDRLYIQVGAGGRGVGSGGGTAGSGVLSYVVVYPHNTASNVVAVSGAAGATGGGTGTGAAVGAAGAAGTIAAIGAMPLAAAGQFSFIAGRVGIAGGAVAGAAGTPTDIPTSSALTCGGAGGAGTTSANFAGGGYNTLANSLLSLNAPVGPAAGSNDGGGGYMLWKPLFSFAGCGGSSSNAGVGGAGGNGGYGSGGGGGGGGTTGGRGGDGGSGLVIIISW